MAFYDSLMGPGPLTGLEATTTMKGLRAVSAARMKYGPFTNALLFIIVERSNRERRFYGTSYVSDRWLKKSQTGLEAHTNQK